MRNLRLTCAATVLTLALAMSALAGQIQCPGAPEPPPPGDMHTPGAPSPGQADSADTPAPGPNFILATALTLLDLAF